MIAVYSRADKEGMTWINSTSDGPLEMATTASDRLTQIKDSQLHSNYGVKTQEV